MKTLTVFLVLALLLAGVIATVLPALTALNDSSDHVTPALTTSDSVPSPRIACANEPCQCPGGDC